MDMQLDPGPMSSHVLSQQDEHRSTDVWDNIDYTTLPLTGRQHLRNFFPPHERVLVYIRIAGFYCIYRLGSMFTMDMDLITALVERWRPETHTFHLAVGEATITLQDVAVLLGLRVDGPAVTGTADLHWPSVLDKYIGASPSLDSKMLTGSSLKIKWLRDTFRELPEDATEETVQHYARAYILMIMGGVLFPDASGGHLQLLYLPLLHNLEYAGQYSWGSATLAYLYRQLCRAAERQKTEIGGPLILIQLWAWEHISIGRPRCIYFPIGEANPAKKRKVTRKNFRSSRSSGSEPPPFADQFQPGQDSLALRWLRCTYTYDETPHNLRYYRDALDRQRDDQFIWEPYTANVLTRLPEICSSGSNVWMTQAPLICFDIVEWHRPERVMQQFGRVQYVPGGCNNDKELHKVDRRGKHHHNWAEYHKKFIEQWDDRTNLMIVSPQAELNLQEVKQQYVAWYKTSTRRMISPPTRTSTGQYQPVASDLFIMGQYANNVATKGREMAENVRGSQSTKDFDGLENNVNAFHDYVSTQRKDLFSRVSVDQSFFWRQGNITSETSSNFESAGSSTDPQSPMPLSSSMPPP